MPRTVRAELSKSRLKLRILEVHVRYDVPALELQLLARLDGSP